MRKCEPASARARVINVWLDHDHESKSNAQEIVAIRLCRTRALTHTLTHRWHVNMLSMERFVQFIRLVHAKYLHHVYIIGNARTDMRVHCTVYSVPDRSTMECGMCVHCTSTYIFEKNNNNRRRRRKMEEKSPFEHRPQPLNYVVQKKKRCARAHKHIKSIKIML